MMIEIEKRPVMSRHPLQMASLFFLSSLLLSSESGEAKDLPKKGAADQTKIIDIPTDLPPPPSAEEVAPNHPFFSEPTTGNEVMEYVTELEERVKKLEESVARLEKGKS